jgi:putative ABC transport system permease protein
MHISRSAVRALTHRPWVTLTAILTIALGIGTNVTIFSVVNDVLLRPLPFRDPDRLVWISSFHPDRGRYAKSSGFDFNHWRDRAELFDSVEAYWDRSYTLTGTDQPEALVGWQFTPNLFSTLGVTPTLGRTFVSEDGLPGRDNVVVLSDALWRRRFNAAREVVGTTMQLDGQSYTIVGVMPPDFRYPYAIAQLWTPLTLSNAWRDDRKQRALRVIARLHDGVTRARAGAELARLSDRLAREYPDTHAGWTVAVRSLRDFYTADVDRLLWTLQATALILLLIAASNVASLILVRASGRRREMMIRVALGASRANLLRQHLAEGFILAFFGTVGGLVLATWGTQLLPKLLATRITSFSMPASGLGWIDIRVLVVTIATMTVTGVLFGVMPFLQSAAGLMQADTRGATADSRTLTLRNSIVVTQIALSVLLLIGAGLLVRSFVQLQSRSFGFRTDGVITAQLLLPGDSYSADPQAAALQNAAFLNALVTRVAALPGVEAAAAINTLPLTGFNALRPYGRQGESLQERFTEFRVVTPDYFRAMSIPLRRGRVFDDRDRIGSPPVVIVNEIVARQLWPDIDPVGQMLMIGDGLTASPKQVVGVVADTRHHDLARDPEPEVYRPAYQASWPFFGLVVRTGTSVERLEKPLRAAAVDLDKNVPINSVRPFAELADTTWAWRRSSMALMIIFALSACLLAFIGVYSVMAYSVTQRSREIGIRIALGASPNRVARGVVRQGALLTGTGLSIGIGLAAALSSLVASLLFGITPLDPLTFTSVALVTACSSLLATAMPAIMASRVDPTIALKAE